MTKRFAEMKLDTLRPAPRVISLAVDRNPNASESIETSDVDEILEFGQRHHFVGFETREQVERAVWFDSVQPHEWLRRNMSGSSLGERVDEYMQHFPGTREDDVLRGAALTELGSKLKDAGGEPMRGAAKDQVLLEMASNNENHLTLRELAWDRLGPEARFQCFSSDLTLALHLATGYFGTKRLANILRSVFVAERLYQASVYSLPAEVQEGLRILPRGARRPLPMARLHGINVVPAPSHWGDLWAQFNEKLEMRNYPSRFRARAKTSAINRAKMYGASLLPGGKGREPDLRDAKRPKNKRPDLRKPVSAVMNAVREAVESGKDIEALREEQDLPNPAKGRVPGVARTTLELVARRNRLPSAEAVRSNVRRRRKREHRRPAK